MKMKFSWLALLASVAMIAQANAGGHDRGGGGFAISQGPARGGPALHVAPVQDSGGNRTVNAGQRFAPTGVRSPAFGTFRQNAIGSNWTGSVQTRQFTPASSRVAHMAQSSNGGNRVITNMRREINGSGQIRNGKNLPSNWRNHVVAQHSANWHHDWDRRHAHLHHGRVFIFVDGFWWGVDPGFYSYYADDSNPDNYYASASYPYDYYEYSPYNYHNDEAYAPSDEYGDSTTVSSVQSALSKLGYYRGAVDGIAGDETQAALARYQEDHDLSVTGTLTAATLQSLRLPRRAS